MQSIAETCVRFDAAHLSINLVSEIAVPMFTTLSVMEFSMPSLHVMAAGNATIEMAAGDCPCQM